MKTFFKTFLSDQGYLIGNFGMGFLFASLICWLISFPNAISFLIFFVMISPFMYYITVYRPAQKKKLRDPLHELIIGEIMFIMKLEKISMAHELDLKTSRWQVNA
jgi:hypothetical protein